MHPTGVEIRDRRKEMGLTIVELAKRVGLTRQWMSSIEKDEVHVSDDSMARICRELRFICIEESETPIDVQITKLRACYVSKSCPLDELLANGEALLKRATQEKISVEVVADLNLLMSQIYRKSRNFSKSYKCASSAQNSFARSGNMASVALAKFELGLIAYDRGYFPSAIDHLRSIEDEVELGLVDFAFETKLYTSIAIAAAAASNVYLMEEYVDKLGERMTELPPGDRTRAHYYYLRGEKCLQSGSYKDAVDSFTRAFHYYSDLNDELAALRMRNNIAEAYFKIGDYSSAEKIAQEVYAASIAANETGTFLAETLILLADIKFKMNDFSSASEHCQQAITVEDCDVSRQAKAYRIIARILYVSGDKENFNVNMVKSMQLLTHPAHKELYNEIVREYAVANHLPQQMTY